MVKIAAAMTVLKAGCDVGARLPGGRRLHASRIVAKK
jgi:hypothetical protein